MPVQCKSSLRMRDITWPVPLCKIWVHIWISHPHIVYSLWHFYLAPMKNKGCLLVLPPMLNAKSSENFLSLDQNWVNFGGFECLGGQGFQKVATFTPKGTSLREPTSFEPFCVKIGRGVWPPDRFGKNNPESHRPSHRKDMSPLTQGLNYRSACDRCYYASCIQPRPIGYNVLLTWMMCMNFAWVLL